MFITIDVEAILETGLARRANARGCPAVRWLPFVQDMCRAVHLRAWITAPRLVMATGVVTCSAAATAASGATNGASR